jgi:hypothetical protein
MDPQRTIAVAVDLLPEEAATLRQHAAETAESGGTVSWFIRCACAQAGLFGRDFDPDLRLRVDDERDA